MKELRILIPDRLWRRLEIIEQRYKMRKEDIITRVLIRTVEEYLGGVAGGASE